METINNLAMATFQLVILFTVAKFISFVKFNLRDYFIIVGIIIPTMFLYYFYGSRAVLIPTFSSIIFLFFKLKYYAIVTILVTMIIMYLSNFATVGLFLTLRKYTTDPVILLPLYILSFSSVSLLATYLVRISLKKFKKSYLSLNRTYMIIISFVLFATFAFFYIYSTNTSSNGDSLIPYALVFIGLIIFISVVILIMSLFTLKEMKYKRNQEEIETYYEYTLKIEAINNEMRKFRHDYVNILTTLSEYIREDDMPGLRDYFNKNIVPMKDNLQMNAIKLNGIENLKVREIKGLITAKILRAQEMSIPISIEIPDEVTHINLNMIDLSRSIGIILDNAIEASTEIDDPIIRVAFIESENSVTFIVMNKCADDIPRIHELFQESFSTKGEGRGLGLSTLKEIADNADNVLLDTIIENGFFIQKVEIINN
ncbi:TPA: sensor histidine kinase [Staphylococcus aureus]|nr:sensor histidine kinase [Staphylococcus aureus]